MMKRNGFGTSQKAIYSIDDSFSALIREKYRSLRPYSLRPLSLVHRKNKTFGTSLIHPYVFRFFWQFRFFARNLSAFTHFFQQLARATENEKSIVQQPSVLGLIAERPDIFSAAFPLAQYDGTKTAKSDGFSSPNLLFARGNAFEPDGQRAIGDRYDPSRAKRDIGEPKWPSSFWETVFAQQSFWPVHTLGRTEHVNLLSSQLFSSVSIVHLPAVVQAERGINLIRTLKQLDQRILLDGWPASFVREQFFVHRLWQRTSVIHRLFAEQAKRSENNIMTSQVILHPLLREFRTWSPAMQRLLERERVMGPPVVLHPLLSEYGMWSQTMQRQVERERVMWPSVVLHPLLREYGTSSQVTLRSLLRENETLSRLHLYPLLQETVMLPQIVHHLAQRASGRGLFSRFQRMLERRQIEKTLALARYWVNEWVNVGKALTWNGFQWPHRAAAAAIWLQQHVATPGTLAGDKRVVPLSLLQHRFTEQRTEQATLRLFTRVNRLTAQVIAKAIRFLEQWQRNIQEVSWPALESRTRTGVMTFPVFPGGRLVVPSSEGVPESKLFARDEQWMRLYTQERLVKQRNSGGSEGNEQALPTHSLPSVLRTWLEYSWLREVFTNAARLPELLQMQRFPVRAPLFIPIGATGKKRFAWEKAGNLLFSHVHSFKEQTLDRLSTLDQWTVNVLPGALRFLESWRATTAGVSLNVPEKERERLLNASAALPFVSGRFPHGQLTAERGENLLRLYTDRLSQQREQGRAEGWQSLAYSGSGTRLPSQLLARFVQAISASVASGTERHRLSGRQPEAFAPQRMLLPSRGGVFSSTHFLSSPIPVFDIRKPEGRREEHFRETLQRAAASWVYLRNEKDGHKESTIDPLGLGWAEKPARFSFFQSDRGMSLVRIQEWLKRAALAPFGQLERHDDRVRSLVVGPKMFTRPPLLRHSPEQRVLERVGNGGFPREYQIYSLAKTLLQPTEKAGILRTDAIGQEVFHKLQSASLSSLSRAGEGERLLSQAEGTAFDRHATQRLIHNQEPPAASAQQGFSSQGASGSVLSLPVLDFYLPRQQVQEIAVDTEEKLRQLQRELDQLKQQSTSQPLPDLDTLVKRVYQELTDILKLEQERRGY